MFGLFLEGASWDHENMFLSDSIAKKLYTELPYMWLLPTTKIIDYELDKEVIIL